MWRLLAHELYSPAMSRSQLLRALRTARGIRAALRRPTYVVPGHFYSPLTSPADVERAQLWADSLGSTLPSVEMATDKQLILAAELGPVLSEPLPGPRYADNSQYGPADGAVFRAMLNHLRPARLLEVGSGFSTAVALDEADTRLPELSVTCVEPYPQRLLGLLQDSDHDRTTLIRKPVQDVPIATFRELEAGDILFIDSTHVAKAGSDVNWLFLHVLPQLQPGVVVHVHDVFWPFEYPRPWLLEHRDWTEDYLLHAFLIGNTSWEILLFSSWLWHCHRDIVPAHLADQEPGSIWLRRVS
jgi:hypothetical protein